MVIVLLMNGPQQTSCFTIKMYEYKGLGEKNAIGKCNAYIFILNIPTFFVLIVASTLNNRHFSLCFSKCFGKFCLQQKYHKI